MEINKGIKIYLKCKKFKMILLILKKKCSYIRRYYEHSTTNKSRNTITNQRDLQTKVKRIKQTIENALYENKSLAEWICTLLHEHGISIQSILIARSKTNSLIALVITGVFVGGGFTASGSSSPKDEGTLEKWFKKVVDALKYLLEGLLKHCLSSREIL